MSSITHLLILDKLDDRDLVPTVGLSALAGIISWGSNSTLVAPVKLLLAAGGAFLSASLTHQRLRNSIYDKAAEIVPVEVKNNFVMIDERVGYLGAKVWQSLDESIDLVNRIPENKLK